jgi:hypothetical protein
MKNVDGRCTSSHENKTFRSRSVVNQKGMVLGFQKTATAVTRLERQIDIWFIEHYYIFWLSRSATIRQDTNTQKK